jgi:hypothetical protein
MSLLGNPLAPLGGEEHLRLMLGVEEFEYRTSMYWSNCHFCDFTYKEKRICVGIFSSGRWSLSINNIVICKMEAKYSLRIRSAFEAALNCTLSF